jgi:hypothetical protein
MPRLARRSRHWWGSKKSSAVVLLDAEMLSTDTYQSDDPDFMDLDAALDNQEPAVMALVCTYQAETNESGIQNK